MMKRNKYNILMTVGGVMLLFAVIAIVLTALFLPKEVQISGDSDKPISMTNLVCSSDYPMQSFFFDTNAERQKYTVKIAYQDNKLSSISFSYVGVFDSEKEADTTESEMHAKFNLYMYDYNLDPEKYNPNFRNLKNEARVDLFSSAENMSDSFARVILSDDNTAGTFTNDEYKKLSDAYEKIGYSCEHSE